MGAVLKRTHLMPKNSSAAKRAAIRAHAAATGLSYTAALRDLETQPRRSPLAREPRRGVTVGCVSVRGGTGKTTVSLNVAHLLAGHGLQVLLVMPAGVTAFLPGSAPADASEVSVRVLHRADHGGVRLVAWPRGADSASLAAYLDRVRAEADVILVDDDHEFRAEIPALVDAVFTCVAPSRILLGRTEIIYSERYQQIVDREEQRTDLLDWLDEAFDAFLEVSDELATNADRWLLLDAAAALARLRRIPLVEAIGPVATDSDDPDDAGDEDFVEEHVDRLAEMDALVEPFLVRLNDLGASVFPTNWSQDSPAWPTHHRAQISERSMVDQGAGGEDLRDDDPESGDVTSHYIAHSDDEVLAELAELIDHEGITPTENVHVLGTVLTHLAADADRDNRLPELAARCARPIIGLVPSSGALQWSTHKGAVHAFTAPAGDRAAAALRDVAENLHSRLCEFIAGGRRPAGSARSSDQL